MGTLNHRILSDYMSRRIRRAKGLKDQHGSTSAKLKPLEPPVFHTGRCSRPERVLERTQSMIFGADSSRQQQGYQQRNSTKTEELDITQFAALFLW